MRPPHMAWSLGIQRVTMRAWPSSPTPSSRPSAASTAPPTCCLPAPTTSGDLRLGARPHRARGLGPGRARGGDRGARQLHPDRPRRRGIIVVRGRDETIRAFYNVCRHRGTAFEERECGKAVRFQCPYHAWIYDLEGTLVRAKHTDDLDDFSFETYSLAPDPRRDLAGVHLPEPGRGRSSRAGDAPRRPRRPVRALRLQEPQVGEADRLRGRRQLEVHRRELQRVLPLPGRAPPAQQAHALRPGRRLRPQRRLAGRLDGARRRRRDDGARRRPRVDAQPAGDVRDHDEDERRIYYYVLWPLAFLSIHPDYLLVHRLEPIAPRRTR